MYNGGETVESRILVVRLGAMGDILHTLPAVASLKRSFPRSRLTWLVEKRWAALLEGNLFVDRVALLDRESASTVLHSWRALRSENYDLAVDFQGLLKSAVAAAASRAGRIIGFDRTRERAAGVFYSNRISSESTHIVNRNLDLAEAAGARERLHIFPIPEGSPEGELPKGDFVLASPLAGWRAKQWPMESYMALAERLRDARIPLVLNLPTGADVPGALVHRSGIAGLIYATRRAAAVIGVDSGPMHLAAALDKPGVAIFGPTDPARNGPYGGSLKVLRAAGAATSYQRGTEIDASMSSIEPGDVFEVLKTVLREGLV